jgi:NADPH:quinone reductase-like Zn-dependent oxidoreductase
MVTVVSTAEGSSDPTVKQAFFIVEPNQKWLFEIADLVEAGRLHAVVDTMVPVRLRPQAYTVRTPRQHRGKVVLDIGTIG